MFEGYYNQLSKVLEMCMDLSATDERPFYERTLKGSAGGGGYNQGSHGNGGGVGKEHDKDKKLRAGRGASTTFEGEMLPGEERIISLSKVSKDKISGQ